MSRSDPTQPPKTVLVVDDSVFMRRMLSDMIGSFEGYQVIGVAADGQEALHQIHELEPDIVTLDIEMPRVDGFQVLERVMTSRPRPVVVVSAYTSAGSEAALRALDLGAVDFVPKPSGPVSLDLDKVQDRLKNALDAAASAQLSALLNPRWSQDRSVQRQAAEWREAAVAIAASTGGPRALSYIVGALPANLGAAVLLVQHMPPGFTTTLAARLDKVSRLPVREAAGGETVSADSVWLAPGDYHMRVRRVRGRVKLELDREKALCGTRPAADALFPSVAAVYAERCVGVVLTGMGRDGTAGLAAIRAASGRTLAQDQPSSVVFGMPGRALESGAAERAVPLQDIPGAIVDCLDTLTRERVR